MADKQNRGPDRPSKEEQEPGVGFPPEAPHVEDERLTTDKPTDGRPQNVGYVEGKLPKHPDFHDNPLVEISHGPEAEEPVGKAPAGTVEVEILRGYVPSVRLNDNGNPVRKDGEFDLADNANGGEKLQVGRIVRLPKKEAAGLIKAGIATTTDNSFDD
jgi:hypothetical protein